MPLSVGHVAGEVSVNDRMVAPAPRLARWPHDAGGDGILPGLPIALLVLLVQSGLAEATL